MYFSADYINQTPFWFALLNEHLIGLEIDLSLNVLRNNKCNVILRIIINPHNFDNVAYYVYTHRNAVTNVTMHWCLYRFF